MLKPKIPEESQQVSYAIIPPGRRFHDGNEEYQFWLAALQFLERLQIAPAGAARNFENQAIQAVHGIISAFGWSIILGVPVNGYGAALGTLTGWFEQVQNIPQNIIDLYNAVVHHRYEQGQRHGGMDDHHRAAFRRWTNLGQVLAWIAHCGFDPVTGRLIQPIGPQIHTGGGNPPEPTDGGLGPALAWGPVGTILGIGRWIGGLFGSKSE